MVLRTYEVFSIRDLRIVRKFPTDAPLETGNNPQACKAWKHAVRLNERSAGERFTVRVRYADGQVISLGVC